MWNDGIEKNINLKNPAKAKKIIIRKLRIKFEKKKNLGIRYSL